MSVQRLLASNCLLGVCLKHSWNKRLLGELFFPITIKDWNALPQHIINIQDTKIFKQEIAKHYSTPQTE